MEPKQQEIIELVEAIFPDKNPIDPYKFDGESVTVGKRIVKMFHLSLNIHNIITSYSDHFIL